MSLPFAEKPESSRVYQDLKTKVLQNLTADEFDQLKGSMFAEGVNGLEDEYRRLLLLGLASDKLSVSGPIPETQINVVQDITLTTYQTWLAPNKGEVWAIMGASIGSVTGASGNITYEIDLYDTVNDTRLQIVDFTSSGSGDQNLTEIGFPQQFVSYPFQCRVRAEGTFTQINSFAMGFVRVR